MRRSTASCLLAIVALGLFLRLSPLLRFAYFGSDIGEYFRLSQGLVDTGHVSLAYAGWGITYPYFPGMFFPIAGTSFGGIELSGALNLVVPTLASLVIVVTFLVTARIFHEDRAALLAAAFIAVAMPHAFLTAHPVPAALGELFAVTALLLFVRLPRDARTWALLLPLTGALIVTHHLSTYFLLVMLLVATGVASLVDVRRPALAQVAFLAILSILALSYWLEYATTFRTAILTDVDVTPWWLPLAAYPALVVGLAALILLRGSVRWRYRPRYPSARHSVIAVGLVFAALVGVMAGSILVAIPGTAVQLTSETLVFFLPVLAFIAFAGAGRKVADFGRDGLAVSGWLIAILGSIVVGAIAAPRVLVPYRHVEYAVIVLAVLIGAGFSRVFDGGRGRRIRAGALTLAGLLLLGGAVTAIPPTALLSNFEEGVRPSALDAAYWTGMHVDGLLATDHRASTLAFGFGRVDATWDRARLSLIGSSFAEARSEMESVAVPSGERRVDFVMIDADLARGVQLFPWEPAAPLPADARAKFEDAPYIKIFDSGNAQVYWVNWGLAP